MAMAVGLGDSPVSRMMTPAGIADPYPIFDELRSERPVCFDEVYGVWVCTSHAVVLSVLSDPTFSSRRFDASLWDAPRLPPDVQEAGRQVYAALGQRMLMQDPPEHTATRRVMGAAFGRRAVALLRPRIGELVDELLEPAAATSQLEVVGELAEPLSIRVIGEVLGVPEEDLGLIERWADDFATSKDVHPDDPAREAAAVRGIADLLDYLGAVVAERRSGRRREDVLQLVVDAAEDDEDTHADTRLAANLAGLLVGGLETTSGMISMGVYSLLRFPRELAKLAATPSLVPAALEELLRFESPAVWILRRATEEVELGGEIIRPGDLVGLFLAAANRDPVVFENPDRLDVTRRPQQHFAFARGRHLCIGAPLARLEGEIVFAALTGRFRRFEPAGEPVWRPRFSDRGLARLEIRLGD